MATDECSVSLWEEGGAVERNCVKKEHIIFGQCINTSFELHQNAITKTQMFFVS